MRQTFNAGAPVYLLIFPDENSFMKSPSWAHIIFLLSRHEIYETH